MGKKSAKLETAGMKQLKCKTAVLQFSFWCSIFKCATAEMNHSFISVLLQCLLQFCGHHFARFIYCRRHRRISFHLSIHLISTIHTIRMCHFIDAVRRRQGRHSAEASAQARAHGISPAAIQPHKALACRFYGRHTIIHANTHLPIPSDSG